MSSKKEGPYKILVVDDEPNILTLLSEVLSKKNYQVTTLPSGKNAITIPNAEEFDLVITDILMPDTDGLEVVLWFKKNYPSIPIIVMSGGSNRLSSDFLLSSMSAFNGVKTLSKPFPLDTLVKLVAECLEK